jgi:hypothetical protein
MRNDGRGLIREVIFIARWTYPRCWSPAVHVGVRVWPLLIRRERDRSIPSPVPSNPRELVLVRCMREWAGPGGGGRGERRPAG